MLQKFEAAGFRANPAAFLSVNRSRTRGSDAKNMRLRCLT